MQNTVRKEPGIKNIIVQQYIAQKLVIIITNIVFIKLVSLTSNVKVLLHFKGMLQSYNYGVSDSQFFVHYSIQVTLNSQLISPWYVPFGQLSWNNKIGSWSAQWRDIQNRRMERDRTTKNTCIPHAVFEIRLQIYSNFYIYYLNCSLSKTATFIIDLLQKLV